jgi:1,2-diacylglycerol 3-beta-galactosyltransferase
MTKKRILILMAQYGYGHASAAKALSAALYDLYGQQCIVEIVNPIEHNRAPAFLRETQEDYDQAVREDPDLYKLTYEVTDRAVTSTVIESALALLLLEAMSSILKSFQPDLIINVYQNLLGPLEAAFTVNRLRIPVLTVVTDLSTIHRMWFGSTSDICVVPTRQAYELALKYKLPPEKVRLIGIPVHPNLAKETRPAADIRVALGWQPDLTTLLVAGSKRAPNMVEKLHGLNHAGLPLQLVIVAGGDDEQYEQLQQINWHPPTYLYNYVETMATFMHAADAIICKAGGLIVSEALACGLPLLLTDVIEGQETGNAEYVLHSGAGELARDPLEVLEVVYHWLAHDQALLQARAAAAAQVGKPRAAYDIAELAWSMMGDKLRRS